MLDNPKISIKEECVNKIKEALSYARKQGFEVVIASDEEGNSWNKLDIFYLDYEGTKQKYIALGVIGHVDESEIFEEEEYDKSIPDDVACEDHSFYQIGCNSCVMVRKSYKEA